MAGSAVKLNNLRSSLLGQASAFKESGLVVAFVVVALLIGIPNPEFFSVGSMIAVLRQSAFVAIMAFGTVFLITMREIDLSISGMFCFGSMLGGVLIQNGHIDPWLALGLCLVAGVCMGTINGVLANLIRVPLMILSLGMLPVYFGATFVVCGGYAIGNLPRSHAFFKMLGGSAFGLPVTVWIACASGIILHLVFTRTRFGASVRTIGSNPAAAELIGIRVRRTRAYTTAMVGLLSVFAGTTALAFFKSAEASLGVGMELRVIAAVVIGGTSLAGGSGTILGASLGALIISMIDSGIVYYGIDPNYSQVVTGLVIAAALAMDRLTKRRKLAESAR